MNKIVSGGYFIQQHNYEKWQSYVIYYVIQIRFAPQATLGPTVKRKMNYVLVHCVRGTVLTMVSIHFN